MTEQPFDALGAVMAKLNPQVIAQRDAAMTLFSECASDFQEARHQLAAAELSGTEDDEARCMVRVRRAERKHADAQQAHQQAELAYRDALVSAWRVVRDVEYRAHETFLREAEARVVAAQQAVIDTDLALVKERDRRIAQRIAPLQAIAERLQLPASEWMPNRQGKYA